MTTNATVKESGFRYQALDGLRGVAALLVVLFHVRWPNHITENSFVQNSYVAVDLFFILSGLVISSNYLHRIANWSEVQTFVGLRFFRLYPLHIAVLGAFVCLEAVKLFAQRNLAMAPGLQTPFTGAESLGALGANIFLLNGLHVLDKLGWNDPSWSISCEFAAYVLFSIVVLSGIARKRLFLIVGFFLAVIAYIAMAFERRTLDVTVDWGIIRCLAGFFFGMLIFKLGRRNILGGSRMLAGAGEVAVGIAIVLMMAFARGPSIVFVIPLFLIAITLLQSDRGPVARLLISPPAQFLGRISYSIYMVHYFLIVCLLVVLQRFIALPKTFNPIWNQPVVAINPWIGDLLVFGIVVGVITTASFTYALIEQPGRLFGRRHLTRPKDHLPTLLFPGREALNGD